jgi:hypothetical protein
MNEAEGAGLDGMQLLRERLHLKLERLALLENTCMAMLSCACQCCHVSTRLLCMLIPCQCCQVSTQLQPLAPLEHESEACHVHFNNTKHMACECQHTAQA